MRNLSLLFWFLAGVAAVASIYSGHRVIEALMLALLVSSYLFSRKAIRNVWDEKRTWWQDNNSIRSDMTFQSVLFVGAALLVAKYLLMPGEDSEESLAFGLLLSLIISFASWLAGKSALSRAERALSPSLLPAPQPQSWLGKVFKKFSNL